MPSTQFVSVGSGKSEGLFGVKAVHQFGPLEIQSILSREQVKKSAKKEAKEAKEETKEVKKEVKEPTKEEQATEKSLPDSEKKNKE